MQQTDTKAKLLVILGVLGVSTSAILVGLSQAPSMVLVFYRIGLAAIFMAYPAVNALKKEASLISKSDLICCLVSGFFLALHFYSYFTALKLTSIASAVVLVDVEVFFVSFAQVIFFKEKLSRKSMLGILITFCGSLIIALGDSNASGLFGTSLKGDLIALAGAFFMSIYTLMGRKCRKTMSTASYTGIVYAVAALTSFLMLILSKTPILGYSAGDVMCAFGMTILCTLLGHSIFSWGLKYLAPAFIATAKLLEPVFASILGILFFAQFPSASSILGGLIVITGIWITL